MQESPGFKSRLILRYQVVFSEKKTFVTQQTSQRFPDILEEAKLVYSFY